MRKRCGFTQWMILLNTYKWIFMWLIQCVSRFMCVRVFVSIFRIIFDCSPFVVVLFLRRDLCFIGNHNKMSTNVRCAPIKHNCRWVRENENYLVINSTMDFQLVVDVLFDLFLFSFPFDSRIVRRLDAIQFFGLKISVVRIRKKKKKKQQSSNIWTEQRLMKSA